MIVLLLLACGADPVPEPSPQGAPPLEPALLLRRLSLDLRGVTPSVAELDEVEADPARVGALRDEWLYDPRFEERLVALFAERWHTRVDTFELEYYDYDLDPTEEYRFERSAGEEPLRLMARIAVEDRPWTDIVTADWTLADEMLAGLHPVEGYPEGGAGWQPVRYTDGRPAVGILATNGLWWRYTTNTSNQNRSRAAVISKHLLCQDPLSRPVSFAEAELVEEGGTAEAIRTQPTCVACHATIEPLAASMFGFWVAIEHNPLELGGYHAEREPMGAELLGVQPGYYGQPVEGLVDLGSAIANDPRFWRCATRSAAEALWRREAEVQDFDRITALQDAWLASGMRYRDLVRAVTDTPEYRAGGEPPEGAGRDLTARMLSTDQLASVVEDLTGFRWTWQGFDMIDSDEYGYRVLVGGVDGFYVGRPQQDPGMTWALVVERLAQSAAAYAVDGELVSGTRERRLFQQVSLEEAPGSPAFRAELEALHRRMYARPATSDRVAAAEALWAAVAADSGPAAAWSALISGMLRDPELVVY